jgi:hypothetical protein
MTVVEEQLVATPTRSTLYLARRIDLRLVKVPRYNVSHADGRIELGGRPGEALEFRNGRLDVPTSGPITMADGRVVDGEKADEVRAWLAKHRLLNDIEDGFWSVDPVAPPVSEDEMRRITDASIDLDEGVLVELIRQESEGWNREQVLAAAQHALERVQQERANIEAAQAQRIAEAEAAVAEEAAKSKPGPKPKGQS